MPTETATEFVRAVLLRNPQAKTFGDIYDAMTWAASTRSFHNLGYKELSAVGVSFALHETSRLAGLIAEVQESITMDLRRLA
jgi:hypothetical protein